MTGPTRRDLIEKMAQSGIPSHMWESLASYILEGCPVGAFLTAVLENDLREAVRCADPQNILVLEAYVRFLWHEAPAECWGRRGITKDWQGLGLVR
jgi:hypothetical protein